MAFILGHDIRAVFFQAARRLGASQPLAGGLEFLEGLIGLAGADGQELRRNLDIGSLSGGAEYPGQYHGLVRKNGMLIENVKDKFPTRVGKLPESVA